MSRSDRRGIVRGPGGISHAIGHVSCSALGPSHGHRTASSTSAAGHPPTLLLHTNGIDAAGGYGRLFGVGLDAGVDMEDWNDPELWQFS